MVHQSCEMTRHKDRILNYEKISKLKKSAKASEEKPKDGRTCSIVSFVFQSEFLIRILNVEFKKPPIKLTQSKESYDAGAPFWYLPFRHPWTLLSVF